MRGPSAALPPRATALPAGGTACCAADTEDAGTGPKRAGAGPGDDRPAQRDAVKGSVNTRGDPLGPQRRVGSLLVLNPLFVEKGEGGAQTQLSDSCRARTSCHGDVDFSLAHAWDTQPPAQTVSVRPGHWGTRHSRSSLHSFHSHLQAPRCARPWGWGLGGDGETWTDSWGQRAEDPAGADTGQWSA